VKTTVVHVNRDAFDVYVGRPMRFRPDLRASGWGNPFTPGRDGDAIGQFREWVQRQPKLMARLGELRGKRLGCWCAPKGGLPGNLHGRVCHGEILAALADALPPPSIEEVGGSDPAFTGGEESAAYVRSMRDGGEGE
jgi:hypothetical protein